MKIENYAPFCSQGIVEMCAQIINENLLLLELEIARKTPKEKLQSINQKLKTGDIFWAYQEAKALNLIYHVKLFKLSVLLNQLEKEGII